MTEPSGNGQVVDAAHNAPEYEIMAEMMKAQLLQSCIFPDRRKRRPEALSWFIKTIWKQPPGRHTPALHIKESTLKFRIEFDAPHLPVYVMANSFQSFFPENFDLPLFNKPLLLGFPFSHPDFYGDIFCQTVFLNGIIKKGRQISIPGSGPGVVLRFPETIKLPDSFRCYFFQTAVSEELLILIEKDSLDLDG